MKTPIAEINKLIQQGRIEDANMLFANSIQAAALRSSISHIYVDKAHELEGNVTQINKGALIRAHAKLINLLAVENEEEFSRVLSSLR